jgi:predicted enzyme related to lactoylglutathione lyase
MSNPVVHFEMPAEDRERVKKFYSSVFGWKMNQMGAEMGDYVLAQTTETDEKGMIKNPGAINGGFYQKTEKDNSTHLVISVEDLAKQIETVKNAGGEIISPTMDIPGIGKFVMIRDTEGNKVGMLQPLAM